MTRLTALLPVTQGVAAYAALCHAADSTTAGGDERGRGQIMADTLVQCVTGQPGAAAVPVEIALVLTDTTLFGHTGQPGADEPGDILGYGPVPADLARDIALGVHSDTAHSNTAHERADVDQARRRIRRLFLHPHTGRLMIMDSKSREFTRNERRFIRYRDQDTCRTPWCDAPARHTDHVHALEHGGRAHVHNGQGLCEACNHAKQAPGWRARRRHDGSIVIATPTGHTYPSRQPDLPGTAPPPDRDVNRRLAALRSRGRLAA